MKDVTPAFAGRSVFLTGHTGFKGSWLALWLHRLGARLSGYALTPPTEPNLFDLARIRQLVANHHQTDLRDFLRLRGAVDAAQPDFVFHLAAQALVRESYAQPRDTFEVNTLGTVNLLEALRLSGRPCVVVVVTSDKCYENRGAPEPYAETDRMGGHDPYSASKGAAELVVAAYRRSFFPPEKLAEHGVKLASVRAGNVIGGGDWAKDRIVADIARALAAGEAIPVRNPGAVRPWQHVLEPLSGYLSLAAKMASSDDPRWCGAWNLGPEPDAHITVRELVERFIAAWGGGEWRDVSDPRQPHEAAVLRLSIRKARVELGWRPRWDNDEAIRRTAAWYRDYYAKQADMRAACLADIDAYETGSPA
jgi:CDP-glucose 4,6-dehydratase